MALKLQTRYGALCCALHNMCLEYDGNQASEFRGELGLFSHQDCEDVVPFAAQRLHQPGQMRSYDTSGMGRGSDANVDVNDGEPEDDETLSHIPRHVQIEQSLAGSY